MPLRQSVIAANDRRGAFRLSGFPSSSSTTDWTGRERRYVLWKLHNDPGCIADLISALAVGVVPILIPERANPQKIENLRRKLPRFDFFDGQELHTVQNPAVADDRPFLCILTSGSTGEPKILVADQMALTAGVTAIHGAQDLDSVASTGVVLPLGYSFALVNQLLWALLYERQVVLLPGFRDPAGTIAQMMQDSIEMICLVGEQVRIWESLRFDEAFSVTCVKVVNCAGGRFPIASFPFLRRLFPEAKLYNNYGCTEAMPRLTVTEVDHAGVPLSYVGKPIRGVALRVAGTEAIGPIEFNAPSASYGVLKPDGTISLHGEWIATGDHGRLDGSDLYVFGRNDQVVKLGGERVSLLELEESLLGTTNSHAAAWANREEAGDSVVAVISGAAMPSPRDVTALLRDRLPRPMWPRTIYWAELWPTLPNGKTDRRELKELAENGSLKQVFPAGTPAK